ncbi:hypothetical protein HHI36_022132 [Cryptolaemus montrouzieri]|uniref:Uncharacterized protein n=1 Tax=Cryptolaemus montrouzieri TaxID=559131 RepID=A0ABD2MYZ8_9CUCU
MENIRFERGLTLQAASELSYSEDVDSIFIELPEVDILTDEDSGDEDAEGMTDNLSGRQLRARAEVKFANHVSDIEETDTEIFAPSVDVPAFTVSSKYKKNYSWVEGDLGAKNLEFPDPGFQEYRDLSPIQLFELFFDDAMINFLIGET